VRAPRDRAHHAPTHLPSWQRAHAHRPIPRPVSQKKLNGEELGLAAARNLSRRRSWLAFGGGGLRVRVSRGSRQKGATNVARSPTHFFDGEITRPPSLVPVSCDQVDDPDHRDFGIVFGMVGLNSSSTIPKSGGGRAAHVEPAPTPSSASGRSRAPDLPDGAARDVDGARLLSQPENCRGR